MDHAFPLNLFSRYSFSSLLPFLGRHRKAAIILSLLMLFSPSVLCPRRAIINYSYSEQDCGIAWAPNIPLFGHPPLSHPGYYCQNSGGVTYGCQTCVVQLKNAWGSAHLTPPAGEYCGLSSTSCGMTASDCADYKDCNGGYIYKDSYGTEIVVHQHDVCGQLTDVVGSHFT